MVKQVLRRFLSLTLAFVLVLSMAPATALHVHAATTNLSGLTVDGLTGQYEMTETEQYENSNWSGNGNTINGSATGNGGTCKEVGKATLTLTNSRSTAAKLSFDYTLTLNGGSVTLGGASVTANGSHQVDLAAGGTFQIELTTQAGDYTTSIAITNISLITDTTAITTFAPAENGSYTVNGTAITQETAYTQSSTVAYALAATPAEGYQFLGWYSVTGKRYLGSSASMNFYSEETQTVTALFGPADAATFETAGGRFIDLNLAVDYAQMAGAVQITLVNNGTLAAGNYTIPSGITLLIPFDEAGTCYTTRPGCYDASRPTPTAFRTLTLDSGANLTVEGALSVSSKIASAGGSSNFGAAPAGPGGRIVMNSGSNITVKSGGKLYVWGFITGPLTGDKLARGAVTMESGSTVYECYQIADFRGGSASIGANGASVFPFSQWYIQNVEVPMTIHSGATEHVLTALYAMGSTNTADFDLISQGGGLFQLADGSYMVKSYDPTTDRLNVDLYGDATLGSISMSLSGMSINSKSYLLPINSNIGLTIHSGTTTISQKVKLLPGVTVDIRNGAVLKVSNDSQLVAYDSTEWVGKKFVGSYGNDLIPVVYTPTRDYNRTANDLEDVQINVDEQINAEGGFYTTSSGAAIISTDGGLVTWTSAAPGDLSFNEYASNSTSTPVSATAARLLNADGTYVTTAGAAAGTVYTYNLVTGKWVTPCTTHILEKTEAVATTCTTAGNSEYYTCSECGKYFSDAEGTAEIGLDSWVIPATGHSMIKTEAKAATCTETGNSEYYTCSTCDKYFSDADGMNEIAEDSWVIPATGHSMIKTEAKAATCTTAGNSEYYTCSTCGKYFSDADGMNEIAEDSWVIPATGHSMIKTEAKAATCAEAGNTEYYTCGLCGKYFSDADGTTAIDKDSWIIPTTGHTPGEAVNENEKAATCTEDGSYESVVYCTVCHAEISRQTVTVPATGHTPDEAVKENEKAATCTEGGSYDTVVCCTVCHAEISRQTVTVPATGHTPGEAVKENEKAATCTEDGSYESVVYCTVCNAEISRETVTVKAEGHSYASVVTAPTCTAQGYTTYTCSVCGFSYEDSYVDAMGHTEEGIPGKEATCTETGLTEGRRCSVCGETLIAQETIPAKGHTWDDGTVTTESTCTDEGVKTYTCTVCDATKTEVISASGHTAVTDAAVEATCTEAGLTEGSHCSVCNASIVAQEVIPALGHSYTSVVTAPTCTERGYTTHTCSRCSDNYVDSYTEVLGHSYASVVTEPTCIAKGYTTHTCSRCDHSYVDSYVEATGHTWNDGEVTKEATCQVDGQKTYTCTVCGTTKVDTIPKKDHTVAIDAAVEATCTSTGLTEGSHCSVCNTVIVAQQIVPMKEHSYESVVTAPTCTAKGYTTYTCSVCNHSYQDNETAATGHSWDEGTATTAATCTTNGEKEHACSACGETKTEIIPATGHAAVVDAAKDPTCTETGLTEGRHCSVCNTVIVAQEEIPATGHKMTKTEAKDPTCAETGNSEYYTCDNCGKYFSDAKGKTEIKADSWVIEAKGHTLTKTEAVAATCTTAGNIEYYTCSVCGKYFSDAEGETEIERDSLVVAATGHTLKKVEAKAATCTKAGNIEYYYCENTCGEEPCQHYFSDAEGKNVIKKDSWIIVPTGHTCQGTVTKEATCTEEGVMTYTCSVCGYGYTERILPTGHTEVEDPAVQPTCTETGLTAGSHCSVCNAVIKEQTVVEALGHTYEKVTSAPSADVPCCDIFTCSVCGDSYTGDPYTGLREFADGLYYLNGQGYAVTGLVRLMDETGHIHYYYFGEDLKAVKDGNYKVDNNNDLPLPEYQYAFDENGIIEHDPDTSKNGICEGDGSKFYYIDGVKVGEGLLVVNEGYYYARTSTGEIVRNKNYYISKTNGLPPQPGMYSFDADGRMLITGFAESDGAAYYYQDGNMVKGFAKVSEDYYFFNAGSGKMYKDTTLWVGSNSYGVPAGFYDFGADGKMKTTGFVTVGQDTYYIQDLNKVKGFAKVGEDYYFFKAGSGKMYRDATLWVGSNDYGISGGFYYFGADGKMVIPDLVNGKKEVVEKDGKLHFAIDGAYMNNGLYELDSEYYYAQSSSTLVTDKTIWVTQRNGLDIGNGGWRAFGSDGKMVKTGFVTGGDGYTYYYEDMDLALGFTKIGDDYYLFNAGSGKMYVNATMWVGANDYGVSAGMYHFGADGKMVP